MELIWNYKGELHFKVQYGGTITLNNCKLKESKISKSDGKVINCE